MKNLCQLALFYGTVFFMSEDDTDWKEVFGAGASLRIAGWVWFLIIIPIIVIAAWMFFGGGFELLDKSA